MKNVRKVLVIAGFDPSCGAGIVLDTKVVRSLGEFAASVITCLTVQTTERVYDALPIDPDFLSISFKRLLRI